MMPYAVDNRRFIAASRLSASERSEFGPLSASAMTARSSFTRPNCSRESALTILRAAASLNKERVPFQLVMVGSGEMRRGCARWLDSWA